MPKGKNQKLKLYRLYKIMLRDTDADHALTLRQVQEKLLKEEVTVDRKTLYEDFAALSELGLQIEKSREGSEYLYRVVHKKFALAELKLLVDAIQASKFITASKSRELIDKLTDFASSYEAGQLDRQVIVAGRVKTMNESIYSNVDAIHSAISQDLQITFTYLQWNIDKILVPRKKEPYMVSPWALTWDAGNYYLVAYDDAAGLIKNYRVDKMDSIHVTEKPRTGKDAFKQIDMAVYTRENFDMFRGAERTVTLRFDNDFVGVMIDRFGKDITIHRLDDSQSEAVVSVAVSNMFFGWISGLGGKVQITAPQSVRNQYRAALQTILDDYADD